MGFQAAMLHAADQLFHFASVWLARAAPCDAPSIAALPTCTTRDCANAGIRPMRARGIHVQVPAEAACQVEDVEVVEADAVIG